MCMALFGTRSMRSFFDGVSCVIPAMNQWIYSM